MAIGKSHRIVIEVDPHFKQEIYLALKVRGLTLKDWFIENAQKDLVDSHVANISDSKAKL